MNVELMEWVADSIEENPTFYDQQSFCGSACCIAGWAVWLAGTAKERRMVENAKPANHRATGHISLSGVRLLGLTTLEAEELFYPDWMCPDIGHYYVPTAKQAAARLRRCIDAGKVVL